MELQIKKCLNEFQKTNTEVLPILKKKKTELENKLEKLEERFAFGDIEKFTFEKFASQVKAELSKIEEELEITSKSTSNLNPKIEKCISAAQNISKTWANGNFYIKQRIQKVVFPEGIFINPKNRQYRTSKMNPVFTLISYISRDSGGKNKNASSDLLDASYLVAGTRLELATFGL